MQRRIERVKSTDTREGLDFRVLSKNGDGTNDFISLPEDPLTAPIIQEIREASITPTTFVSREFQNNFDDQWYIEQYAYKSNNVVRFGINHLSDQVFSSLSSESVPLLDVTARATSTAKSSSKYTKDDATQISLCQLETLLLNKACNYLLAAEEDTRAVLVDIFVRVNGGTSNGAVKLEGKVPEIHTVVLYKNPTVTPLEGTEGKGTTETLASAPREITVIDPSNFIFSSHLSNYNNLSATGHEGDISFTTLILHAISLEESAKAKTEAVDILSHSEYNPSTEFQTTLTHLLEHNAQCVSNLCKTLSDSHSVLLGLVEHIEDGGI